MDHIQTRIRRPNDGLLILRVKEKDGKKSPHPSEMFSAGNAASYSNDQRSHLLLTCVRSHYLPIEISLFLPMEIGALVSPSPFSWAILKSETKKNCFQARVRSFKHKFERTLYLHGIGIISRNLWSSFLFFQMV